MADSNRSRARARARRRAEQAQALRAVVRARAARDRADAALDRALTVAVDQHVRSADLAGVLGVSVATLWRTVAAARQAREAA